MLLILYLIVAIPLALWFTARYTARIMLTPEPYTLQPEFKLLAAEEGFVALPPPPSAKQFAATDREGVYNLLYEGGYGRLGDVIKQDEDTVIRPFTLTSGCPPKAADPARLDYVIHRSDPLTAHGYPYEDLTLQGEVGKLKAWWLPQGDTAVLMLHGRRRAERSETLRVMPTLIEAGYGVMALGYRNHDASDPSPDGFIHYGASEWQDAMTALRYLASRGVKRAVIYGFSMGGAITLETAERLRELERKGEAPVELAGIILDAPLGEPRTTFEQNARVMGIPEFLVKPFTTLGMAYAARRVGIDWRALDQRETIHEVGVPVLLIHGSADSVVPVSLSDELARRAPALVEYHRVEGAEHIEAWNQGPERYETWVRTFLEKHVPLRREAYSGSAEAVLATAAD